MRTHESSPSVPKLSPLWRLPDMAPPGRGAAGRASQPEAEAVTEGGTNEIEKASTSGAGSARPTRAGQGRSGDQPTTPPQPPPPEQSGVRRARRVWPD